MRPTHPARTPRWLLLAAAVVAPAELAGQTSLVIYRDGRVLAQRTVTVTVPRGISRHRIDLEQFDAGSLVTLDSGVVLSEVQYPRQLDEASMYRAMVGRRLLFETFRGTGPDTVSAMVTGDDPPRFEMPGGLVRLSPPGTPLFPRDLIGSARPTLVTVESSRPLNRLVLGYVTSGASWQVEYAVALGSAGAVVSGRVVLSSAEIRADSAEIAVLEGQVSDASGFAREAAGARDRGLRLDEIVVRGMPAGQLRPFGGAPVGVGGFRLYPVAGRYQLSPGAITVAPLFPVERANAIRVYVVSGRGLAGGGDEAFPVEVRYRIARSRQTPFGRQPLPPGVARLYSRVGIGAPVLIGEAAVAHTDPEKTLELIAGQAVELTVRRLRFATTNVADTLIGADRRPTVSHSGQVADAEFRFSNATDTLATVELTEPMARSAVVVSSSVPAQRVEAGLRFTVQVPPRGETILRYRVRLNP